MVAELCSNPSSLPLRPLESLRVVWDGPAGRRRSLLQSQVMVVRGSGRGRALLRDVGAAAF